MAIETITREPRAGRESENHRVHCSRAGNLPKGLNIQVHINTDTNTNTNTNTDTNTIKNRTRCKGTDPNANDEETLKKIGSKTVTCQNANVIENTNTNTDTVKPLG